MSTTITFQFNDIFKNYDDYKEFTDEIELYSPSPELDLFNKWCFDTLMWRYSHRDIGYGTPELFLTQFANILVDHFNQYYKQKQLVDAIYKFDLDEFSRIREIMNSIAVANNQSLIDPSKWVGFISQQNYTNEQLSKIDGYLKGIQMMPTYDRKSFADKFSFLFTQLHTPTNYVYTKGKQ